MKILHNPRYGSGPDQIGMGKMETQLPAYEAPSSFSAPQNIASAITTTATTTTP